MNSGQTHTSSAITSGSINSIPWGQPAPSSETHYIGDGENVTWTFKTTKFNPTTRVLKRTMLGEYPNTIERTDEVYDADIAVIDGFIRVTFTDPPAIREITVVIE